MTNEFHPKTVNPITFLIKSIVGKFRQQPGVYPIKYYKKHARYKRHRHEALVK